MKEEDFKSKYVNIENFDETTKKMLELKRKGGDITQLIQAEAQIVHPLKDYNLEDERVQEGLVRQKLAHLGNEQDVIDFKINKLKKELNLDKEAEKVIKEINDSFDAYVEKESQRQLEELTAQKEKQKEFRKTMSDMFKTYDIEDNIRKSLLDSSTKNDDNGLSDVDKAFFEAKNNPELFAQVAFLLTDREAYNKYTGIKIKNKTNLDTVQKVYSLKKRESKGADPVIKQQKGGLEALFQQQQQQ